MADPVGQPKVGSPEWFIFDATDLAGNLAPLASYLSLSAMDLPQVPQNTASFCALAPPSELPTLADYAGLVPPFGFATGSYRRFGNWVKASKWGELCQYVSPPYAPGDGIAPAGYYTLPFPFDVTNPGDSNGVVYWHLGPGALANVDSIAIVQDGGSCVLNTANLNITDTVMTEGVALGTAPNTYGEWIAGNNNPGAGWKTMGVPEWAQNAGADVSLTSYFTGFGPCTMQFRIAMRPKASVDYTPPEAPAAPDGFPTTGDACSTSTLADVCRTLLALDAKVSYLASLQHPPVAYPDDQPTPAASGTRLARPPLAVAVVIELTTIPPQQPSYGDPKFWPSVGHVVQMTSEGPLPGVLIRHNPMVLMVTSPLVTDVVLDLADGVEGQIRWLNAPK